MARVEKVSRTSSQARFLTGKYSRAHRLKGQPRGLGLPSVCPLVLLQLSPVLGIMFLFLGSFIASQELECSNLVSLSEIYLFEKQSDRDCDLSSVGLLPKYL